MKNKFNIGDKVMVRGDLEIGEWYGGLVFLPLMAEHHGTISEIINVEFRNNYSCCYFLKDMYSPVGYPWYWSEEMLENPVVHLCNVEVKKASKDSAMGSLKISKVGESHEWAEKPGSYPWGCKFKKGDSVKVTKQFTDVKTGYYQVLDAICINEKSWYTLKGAPMIWVPEENLEINDHDSVKETFKKVKEEPLKKNALMDESEGIIVRRVITELFYRGVLTPKDYVKFMARTIHTSATFVFGELMDYLEKMEED